MDETQYRAKDPRELARRVIPALFVFLAAAIFQGLVAARRILSGEVPAPEDPATALAGLLYMLALVSCAVITLRWFYRASTNAHVLARGLTISPGWSIGWYLVPVAYLWMPYKAFSETWRASLHREDWKDAPTPTIVGLWWGLWLTQLVFSYLASQFALDPKGPLAPMSDQFQVVATLVQIPLVIVLALIVKQLTAIQVNALKGYDFD